MIVFRNVLRKYATVTLRRTFGGTMKKVVQHYKSCQQVQIPSKILVPVRSIHFSSGCRNNAILVEGPSFAESISEGDIRWLKNVGDTVSEDELVAEIETDKTTVECPAPQSGTIVEFLVEDGARVTAKQKLYKLLPGNSSSIKSDEKPKAEEPKKSIEKVTSSAQTAAPPSNSTSKPSAGEIPKNMPSVKAPSSKPISSVPVSGISLQRLVIPPGVSPEHAISGTRDEVRVSMNRMRQRISQRLKDAQNTYAMLTTFNEIDMSNILEMRKKYQNDFQKRHGIKLGLMSPFVRAAAYALTESPVINAVIDENEIVYRRYVDISVAVATPKGLVVPVLRNVESMNYAQIEKELADLGGKARDGKLSVEDMEGGTFTISNGGVFGSVLGTPIINPPQSAILGMHGIFDRPVAIDGKVEIRPIMNVALTYDHRLIDGREAVTFLKKIKASVEDPRTIMMQI